MTAFAAFNRRVPALLVAALAVLTWSTWTVAAQSGAKRPLTYDAYDYWKSVAGARVSDDGQWFVYSLTSQGEDPELVFQRGGSASVKAREIDLYGQDVDVLHVSGDDEDLATIQPKGFAACDLVSLRRLADRAVQPGAHAVGRAAACVGIDRRPGAEIDRVTAGRGKRELAFVGGGAGVELARGIVRPGMQSVEGCRL